LTRTLISGHLWAGMTIRDHNKLVLVIAACLALLAILFAAPAPAPQGALVQGKVAARLSFGTQSGLITIPVRVNGSKELRMYLDTGMSAPVVVLFHKESIDELGLKGVLPVVMAGAGGQAPKQATLATGATIGIGALEMTDQRIVVTNDSRETSEWPVEGIIGKSLFDKYLAEIDYEKSALTFYEPAGAKIEPGAAPISIDLATGIPLIEGVVDVQGGKKLPLKLAVDIGHRSALSLNEDAAKGVLPPPRTITSIAGRGLQGVIQASIGRIASLEIGAFTLRDIPAAFLAPGTNPGLSRATVAGNVGSLVWRRFRILLDYPGKRMFLVPNAYFKEPFPFNMAGLVLEQDRDDVYFVRYVVENSPAGENGLKEGDKITAINGTDVRKYSYRQVLDIFNAAGKKVKLTLERGGERLEKTLKLRRLI
jgi:hypothetical protein